MNFINIFIFIAIGIAFYFTVFALVRIIVSRKGIVHLVFAAVLVLISFFLIVNLLERYNLYVEFVKFKGYLFTLLPFLIFVLLFVLFTFVDEEILKESEEKYRIIVEESFDGIFIFNGKRLTFVNSRMEEITGYKRKELLTMNPLRLIHPGDLKFFFSFVREMKKGIKRDMLKIRIKKKNGDSLLVSINFRTITQEGETVILGTLRDITQQEKMREELFKQEKLRSLAILAGGIAHDFNNFLTGILGNLSLLRMRMEDKKVDKEVIDSIDDAVKAAERAGALTHQLLNFTKSGNPVKKATSVEELIKESAEFSLRGSKSKCEYYIESNLPPINVDPAQISEVIQNLVLNASMAMPDGGVIKIYAKVVDVGESYPTALKSGRYLKISVVDTGVGIPEENLERIFDPFFTTKENGSGLGLSMCYRIVKNHDGHIEVESEVGKGTSFHVYLPYEIGESQEAKGGKVNGQRRMKGRILIMDDEEYIRNLVKRTFESHGLEVSCVEKGEDAVDSYKKAMDEGKPFDAVILDMTIPGGMGGVETAREILEIDPDANLIVSSGYTEDMVMANYKDYGFKASISKPYKVEKLLKVIGGFIND